MQQPSQNPNPNPNPTDHYPLTTTFPPHPHSSTTSAPPYTTNYSAPPPPADYSSYPPFPQIPKLESHAPYQPQPLPQPQPQSYYHQTTLNYQYNQYENSNPYKSTAPKFYQVGGGGYADDYSGGYGGYDLYGGASRYDSGGYGGGYGVCAYQGSKVEPYGSRGTGSKSSTWKDNNQQLMYDDFGRPIGLPSGNGKADTQVGMQHQTAKRKSMTIQPDGSGGKHYKLADRSSQLYKPLPEIKTNLKLTANILLKNARDGFSRENIVCSPLSLNFIMNLVAVGSKGDTLRQLLSFIGSSSLEDCNLMSTRIMEVTSQTSTGGPHISFVNGVWVNEKLSLKPSYNEVLNYIYKAEVKNVKMAQAVEEVNSWVDKKTKGLIKEILSHGSVDDTTMVILGNALYFKGVWSNEFNTRWTQQRDFHLLSGKTVSVPFMTSYKMYFYGASDSFKVLKIPYQRGSNTRQFSMYFLLPHEIDGLQNLLEKLKSNPDLLYQDFGLREVNFHNFWIPKFKFSYNFEAQREMQHLGLTLPFDYNCKEITEMVDTVPGANVYVSKVIHKAVIEVDEKGTEAAAVTVSITPGCAFPSTYVERYEFVADHPFLFMIREEMTGAILFVGTVFNPLKN